MMQHKIANPPSFRLVKAGDAELERAVAQVIRHFDDGVIQTVIETIQEAVDRRAMRFLAMLAFRSLSGSNEILSPGDADDPRQSIAAAYLLEYPGKLASLVGPMIDGGTAVDISNAAATQVIEALVNEAKHWDVELVQSVVPFDTPHSISALRQAGMQPLASLFHMVLDVSLSHHPDQAVASEEAEQGTKGQDRWIWRRYSPEERSVWIDWMDATYESTMDCPELNGLRTTSNTLDGYIAASGVEIDSGTLPEWWGAFDVEAMNRGDQVLGAAFLLSGSNRPSWELSYMGVAPEYRGSGLGKLTLRRAVTRAQTLGAERLSLAVDRRNIAAIGLYHRCGFRFLCQLEAWFLALKG